MGDAAFLLIATRPDAAIVVLPLSFAIGILSGAPQPVVVSDQFRNVPEVGIWAYDPGAHFGIHRIDEFYFEDAFMQVSQ